MWDTLLTGPHIVGAVGWIALIIGVLGFGITIYQVKAARSSSDAALIAVTKFSRTVRKHEEGALISDAEIALSQAQAMVASQNSAALDAHISNGLTLLRLARQLVSIEDEKLIIQRHILALQRIVEMLRAPATIDVFGPDTTRQHYSDLTQALQDLSALSARTRYQLSGLE